MLPKHYIKAFSNRIDVNLTSYFVTRRKIRFRFIAQLSVSYDTFGVSNVNNSEYHLKIAKCYPELVTRVLWADNNTESIKLEGILGTSNTNNKIAVSTKLPSLILYYLPFLYNRR